ncbi:OmpH family outer membrane protein [Runella sp. MFBS21]|uniref:OmpH family outer membrane protein n=1 Tax=Runella sp. MFBS21 TaxID=3034018 RepID=UPI0023F8BB84|nr:OmpH family outer membrane protein [Runella sp. MFBS21]MDF7821329.1 OmpH family outer membrane protein [Runella sp. MFBS21]
MKNGLLIWNAVLTLAVAFLGYQHFSHHSSDSGSSSVSEASKGKKIVYVQADSLLKNYDYYKDFQKEFESKGFQLENDLANKGRTFQNKIAFFQQRAQQGALSQDQAQAAQAQLGKEEQEIAKYRDDQLRKLDEERIKKTEEFYTNIFDYIKRYNKDNGYEFVLGYSKGGGILFADASLDVTQKMVEGLNKEYKDKAAAPAKK